MIGQIKDVNQILYHLLDYIYCYTTLIMRMQKILFIIGILVFITPIIALPPKIETIVFLIYGIAIMVVTSRISCTNSVCFKKEKELHTETFSEKQPVVEEKIPDFNGVAEEIIQEQPENNVEEFVQKQ